MFYVYIYMLATRVCHIPFGKLGCVTPKGGVLPKGIGYKGLPGYFSVFPFLLVKHYMIVCIFTYVHICVMISFAQMTF